MPNLNLIHSAPRERYEYDLSHDFAFSARIGSIFPVNMLDCLPGDTIKNQMQLFARLAPLVHPIFQKVKCTLHSFFVPYRLIYPNIYRQVFVPQSATNVKSSEQLPQLVTVYQQLFKLVDDKALWDGYNTPILQIMEYVGCPVETWRKDYELNRDGTRVIRMSLTPFLAYYLIYKEYFADSLKEETLINSIEDLIQSVGTTHVGDFQITELPRVVFKPCFNRDYFNTAQFQPQMGSDVNITMDVVNSAITNVPVNTVRSAVNFTADGPGIESGVLSVDDSGTNRSLTLKGITSGFTINDLKELFAKQKWADIGNQFGQRYIEQVLGHFGVQSSDARLSRPDYIGSKMIPLQISEVTQLSETANTPLGQMAGRGVGFGGDSLKDFFCEEHGVYVTLMSIVPDAMYSQGMPKWLKKISAFDFAWPEFATIGEQEVAMSEILDDGDSVDKVFGYQERYAEYKRAYNRVAGSFASDLLSFTMAIHNDVGSPIDINTILKPQDDDIDRCFAVPDTEHLYCLLSFDLKRVSVLPYIDRTIPNLL